MKLQCPLILVILLGYSFVLTAQNSATYTSTPFIIEKAAVQNMSSVQEGFDLDIRYLEAPAPDGDSYWDALLEQKAKSAVLYPRMKQEAQTSTRGAVDMPQLFNNFVGNNTNNGAPCDNHLSISNDGQLVSVVNRHFAVKSTNGFWLSAATLENYTDPLNISATKYDPKTLYDPINDRFIVVMLAGFSSNSTTIIVAVSDSNDAAGDWSMYTLPGNPFEINTWSDYPMITMTDESLYLTINLIYDDEPWETGFRETLIWKMSLEELYAGTALDAELISDIKYEGSPIRNVCPVQYATEERSNEVHFLSNRNFDLENDTIFYVKLIESPDSSLLSASISPLISDLPYGVPPNVDQQVGYLSTNDARILDAVLIDDEIQFVGNTVDFATGTAAVFHGVIEDINTPSVSANYLLTPDSRELGYPSIAFTGDDLQTDRDVIILAAHASTDTPAGYSACYMDNNGDYSEWLLVKEGDNYIDMLNVSDGFERWGDYSATQRVYNDPGKVWVSSTFGESDRDADTWLSCLGKPGYVNSVSGQFIKSTKVAVFPNPSRERFSLLTDIPESCKKMEVRLLDINGRLIKLLYSDKPKRVGEAEFSFDISGLATGSYLLSLSADGVVFAHSKVLID
jgi:hypothetical protein